MSAPYTLVYIKFAHSVISIVLAIFVPKIIKVNGNLTKFWRKQFWLRHSVEAQLRSGRNVYSAVSSIRVSCQQSVFNFTSLCMSALVARSDYGVACMIKAYRNCRNFPANT